jgi:hypothetical protein
MKNKKVKYFVVFVSIVLVTVCGTLIGMTQKNTEMTLTGSTNKNVYILGEPVVVGFEFKNTGRTPRTIVSGGVSVGSLKILIAREEGEFNRYVSGSWGRKRGIDVLLAPDQVYKYDDATILWNGKPDVSHLNENSAREFLKDKITTEYAFQEPGVYFIKGLSYYGENSTPVESEPVRIEIQKPTGSDLLVWNQIKGNKEIAYLLQNGSLDVSDAERKSQLISLVEGLIEQHPDSVFSNYLKPNLAKYKAAEERRNSKNLKP